MREYIGKDKGLLFACEKHGSDSSGYTSYRPKGYIPYDCQCKPPLEKQKTIWRKTFYTCKSPYVDIIP